jgi:hypothetical protein
VARWGWSKPKGRHAARAAAPQLPVAVRPVVQVPPWEETASVPVSWVTRPEPELHDEVGSAPELDLAAQAPSQPDPLVLPASRPLAESLAELQEPAAPAAGSGGLVESIAALLASGEAWASPAPSTRPFPAPSELVPAPEAPLEPVGAEPVEPTWAAVESSDLEPALAVTEPVAAAGPVLPVSPLVATPSSSDHVAPAVAADPAPLSGPVLVPDLPPVASVPARAYDPLTDPLLEPLERLGAPPALLAAGIELDLASLSLSAAASSVPTQPSGRVQLGFRDGSTASLAPDSEQAAALEELAELLNWRD